AEPITYQPYDPNRPEPFVVGCKDEITAAQQFASFVMSTIVQSPIRSLLVFGLPGSGKSLLPTVLAHRLRCWSARVSCNGLVATFDAQTDAPQQLRTLENALSQYVGPKLIALDELDAVAPNRTQHQHLLSVSHWVMNFLGFEDAHMKTAF